MDESLYSQFKDDIEEFTGEYVTKYLAKRHYSPGKVIHDSLWGTQYLRPHEVTCLDLPLLQRLRAVRQTAYTYLVFPSTTHTRFEHTLGVVYQATRLFNALREKGFYKGLLEGKDDLIRLAALFHDCGHGPLSHSSEETYMYLPDMENLVGEDGGFEDDTPHEVMAYHILKSDAFKTKFEKVRDKYNIDVSPDSVADIIIGKTTDALNKYIVDFINGPFDADKLDYLFRDGHFSGLPLKIDLDRLWYAAQIQSLEKDGKTIKMLVMSSSGITPLEQILFSRMVLFTSVYQHHKVRTCDCMLKGIFEYCWDNGQKICGRDLKRATDFLWITDEKLFSEADKRKKDDQLHISIHNLQYRRLWKRALIISKSTVQPAYGEFFGYSNLKAFSTTLKTSDRQLRELAGEIWETAGKPCLKHELWIDLPKLPPTGTADDTYVNQGTQDKPNLCKLKEIFRVDDWAQNYAEHKWRGHVFCPDGARPKVAKAAKDVLETRFNIKFKEEATAMCKIDEDVDYI